MIALLGKRISTVSRMFVDVTSARLSFNKQKACQFCKKLLRTQLGGRSLFKRKYCTQVAHHIGADALLLTVFLFFHKADT